MSRKLEWFVAVSVGIIFETANAKASALNDTKQALRDAAGRSLL